MWRVAASHTLRSFPRKRETQGNGARDYTLRWVPAFAGTSGEIGGGAAG